MTDVAVALCREGFEAEAVADLAAIADHARLSIEPTVRPGSAYVVARFASFDDAAWRRAARAHPATFARSLWTGPKSDRQADLALPDGVLHLRHLTGKAAETVDRLDCAGPTIVVVDRKLANPGRDPDCILLDAPRLRRTGAMAIDIDRGRPRLRPSQGPGPGRIWQ